MYSTELAMLQEELIDKTDRAIGELVYPKYLLQKAYNYYNGIRNTEEFKYLEDTYGVSNPTSLHFTPLIKKHIDALIGEYLGTPIIPKIFCKDVDTINNIDRERQLQIDSELYKYLKSHLQNSILAIMDNKETKDSVVQRQLESIKEDVNNNFISDYEIAAQNVIEYIMQSRETDMMTALRDLLLDLLITGYAFYKVEPTVGNNNIKIRVLNPLNTFVDRNFESPYIKDSYRAVVRTWMSKSQVLNKYGKDMKRDDIKLIKEKWESMYDSSTYYIHARDGSCSTGREDIDGNVDVTPGFPTTADGLNQELIPVYEVEWLETDKDFVMQRYKTVRIGEEIYILYGKDEPIRSISNPTQCGLSINGIYFLNRGVEPYSMVLACTHLQD